MPRAASATPPLDWATVRRSIEAAASEAQRFKLAGCFAAALEAYDRMVELGGVLPGRMLRAALATPGGLIS